MPDRDKIHPQLPRRYYTPYRQICEGHESVEEIARAACKGLRKDIQEYGDVPLEMIDNIRSDFDKIASHPLFLPSVDWGELSRKVDDSNRKISGNNRAKAICCEAFKKYIHSLRFEGPSSEDYKMQILSNYIDKIYISNFEEMIPLNQQHYNDETQDNVCKTLIKIRPYAESHIKDFAEKILRTGTVKSIFDPKHPRSGEPFDIFADILQL